MNHYDDSNILEKNIDTRRVFDGIILHIDHLTNRLPNGKTATREVARHVGAAAIIPVDDAGNVYFVRQFRATIDQVLLEIPAGKLNARDEDRLEAAQRELEEETGLTAGRWTHLTDILTTPGFSDELISIYLAQDLSRGESHPDDDEFLNLVRMPLDEAVSKAMAGEIRDVKTLSALLMADKLCR